MMVSADALLLSFLLILGKYFRCNKEQFYISRDLVYNEYLEFLFESRTTELSKSFPKLKYIFNYLYYNEFTTHH